MLENTIEKTINNTPEIATKRARILAFFIDFFIIFMIGMIFGYFFGEPVDGIGFELHGGPALLMMLIGFFLWPISEGLWGQTLGKRVVKLKVLTDDYESIEIVAAIGRYFFGFLDCMFLSGLIVAATNDKNKRIGDLVAKTIVVQLK